MADGTLGPTFGLSLPFNKTKPREARACMTDGYGAELMGVLQGWGLADVRWRLIADACLACHVGHVRDDGSEGRLASCALFDYAREKFVDGKPQPAEFYPKLRAAELSPDGRGGDE